ncbi:sugar phosphate isomerase/epimerase family protein [Haloarchaeobius sp. TZWSO28]|uniref:sugar phosphate isomerase/epimerase family protein n=1 Tax=Haloarchaeobius sp. TZWSO28 TaxID=3446119 RepID=UPI003EC118CC
MVSIGIQLYTLVGLDESLLEKTRRVAETDFDGVEFAGIEGSDPHRLAADLAEAGLEPLGAHVDVDELEADYEEVVETYRAIGCTHLVIPRYDPAAFETVAGVEEAAERISSLARRLASDGFRLSYHNHRFEFVPLGDATAFDVFVDHLDDLVGLEIDTGSAQHAGQDPVELLNRYSDRIDLVHLTDTRSDLDSTVHVELAAGEVDLAACVRAARDTGVDAIIYEHGKTTDPVGSLQHGNLSLPRLTL